MEVKNIIIFVVIVGLVIIVLKYMMSDTSTLSTLTSAKSMQQIEASDLATDNGTSSQFTYSIWFYVDDWNYRYGEPKTILGRMTTGTTNQPCPSITFAPVLNNIIISLAVYPSTEIPSSDVPATFKIDRCIVENIPIQKWTNLLISVYNRTLDVYLNGKLVRTVLLTNVAKIDSNAPVYITPSGGFSGWTSKFQYWSTAYDPQKAWNIYAAGYGGSSIGNMLNSYSVKVSVMDGDTETSSYTI